MRGSFIYTHRVLIAQQFVEILGNTMSTGRSLCIFPFKRALTIIDFTLYKSSYEWKIWLRFIIEVDKYLDVAIDCQSNLIAFVKVSNTNDISIIN